MKSLWNELVGAEVRFYDVGGIRTRTIEAGQGPTILLLHGSGGHAEAYARNILPLAKNNRVIAMDYLGSGLTGYPPEMPSMRDRVQHLIGLLDEADVDDAIIVGESFGGSHAFSAAHWYPARVRGLVIVVGGGPYEVEVDESARQQLAAGMQRLKDLNARIVEAGSADGIRERLGWLFYRPEESLTDELIELRGTFYELDAVRRSNADLSAGLNRGDPVSVPFTPEMLAATVQPTLFIWTDHNPTIPSAMAKKASEYVPDARFVEMKNCAHWPQWEDPAAFNALILRFADELSGRP